MRPGGDVRALGVRSLLKGSVDCVFVPIRVIRGDKKIRNSDSSDASLTLRQEEMTSRNVSVASDKSEFWESLDELLV